MDPNWIPAVLIASGICGAVALIAVVASRYPLILLALPVIAGVAWLLKRAMDRA
jgi:hypothetical protein